LASLLYFFADEFPGQDSGRPWWIQELCVAAQSADTWVYATRAGGMNELVCAEAMALDTSSVPQACWCDSLFRYEGVALDAQAYVSSLAIDRQNRPCIAYTGPALLFTFRTGGQWRPDTVSLATTPESYVSLVLGDDGQPLIAFSTDDGLWLAHGVDIVGQSEERQEPTAHSLRLTASVVRGVLWLQGDGTQNTGHRAELLDAAGRKMLVLQVGANDVRSLAPGVYFVLEAQAQAQAQAVRKVVVQR
jgi:hypothetical protein